MRRFPLCLLLAASACVTTYQPLTSLQRPVVVDPREGNLDGLKLRVDCLPSDDFDRGDAEELCSHLGTLFRNQGATVETDIPRSAEQEREPEGAKTDLVVSVRSRTLKEQKSPLLAVLSVATFTIVPMITETSFAQDVTIRDGAGSLLAVDTLSARFIQYFGVAVWGANKLADWLVRSPPDRITGDVASEDFSRDFYGQLSQLAFNARVRTQVLHDFGSR